jgi:hypothetical protein
MEEALRIKESQDADLAVLTMGPKVEFDAIRNALAMGTDDASLTDPWKEPIRGPADESFRPATLRRTTRLPDHPVSARIHRKRLALLSITVSCFITRGVRVLPAKHLWRGVAQHRATESTKRP